jgi:hypothetical protein
MSTPPLSTANELRARLATAGTDSAVIRPEDIADTYAAFNGGDPMAQTDRPAAMMAPRTARDPGAEPLGVIVETRAHPNLVPVTRQVLAQGIAVQIVHGTQNAAFVAEAFASEIAAGRVHLTATDYGTMGRDDYNGLLLCRAFWEALVSRGKILIFQTDAVLCPASPYGLKDFLDFDYIGSAWGRERKRGIVVDGGNGGLSLRDWTASVDCLDRFPPAKWWAGGEDSYFGFHIDLIGGRVAQPDEAARFGTQFWFLENSFGAHKPQGLSFPGRALFLAWCPEGRILFSHTTPPTEYRLGRLLAALGLARPATRLYRTRKRA